MQLSPVQRGSVFLILIGTQFNIRFGICGGARRRRRRNAAFAMVREGDGGEQECARWYAVVREGDVNEKSCGDTSTISGRS